MSFWGLRNLGFLLTLFQPGGSNYSHRITACTPGFENLTTSIKLLLHSWKFRRMKLMLSSLHFFVLVDDVTKIWKYYIIMFVFFFYWVQICKARWARQKFKTEHVIKKILQLKWLKYEKTKLGKWNEPNISHLNFKRATWSSEK